MNSNPSPSESSTTYYFILKPFIWTLTLLQFTYFFISSLILWIIRPLASRCQTFRLARELDKINEKMRKLRSDYEKATRQYHEQCQHIDQKRRELNEHKDRLVLQLAAIDQWSKQVKPKEPMTTIKTSTSDMKTISTYIKDYESIAKNVDTKSMAKWFDRQFSCGAQSNTVIKTSPLSSPLLRSPSRTSNAKKSEKILTKSLSLDPKSSASSSEIKLMKLKNQSKFVDSNGNGNQSEQSHPDKMQKSDDDKVLDQMVITTLNEFRSNETNSELNQTIRELYNDPEWKPMIDQLRNQYQLFSFI